MKINEQTKREFSNRYIDSYGDIYSSDLTTLIKVSSTRRDIFMLPASVHKIEDNAFYVPENTFDMIDIEPGNNYFSTFENGMYSRRLTVLYAYAGKNYEHPHFQSEVQKRITHWQYLELYHILYDYVFRAPTYLEEIKSGAFSVLNYYPGLGLNYGLKTIGDHAIKCTGLNIVLPQSVTKLGKYAVSGEYIRLSLPFHINEIPDGTFLIAKHTSTFRKELPLSEMTCSTASTYANCTFPTA